MRDHHPQIVFRVFQNKNAYNSAARNENIHSSEKKRQYHTQFVTTQTANGEILFDWYLILSNISVFGGSLFGFCSV
jgi:hypothetical protein